MDPLDSIDGLGMTIGDLSGANAAAVAQFRLTKRIERRLNEIQTNEIRPAFVAEMEALVASTKRVADVAQTEFGNVGTNGETMTRTTTRTKKRRSK